MLEIVRIFAYLYCGMMKSLHVKFFRTNVYFIQEMANLSLTVTNVIIYSVFRLKIVSLF